MDSTLTKPPYKLWIGAEIQNRLVGVYHRSSYPGEMTWHLTDFTVQVDGKIQYEDLRCSAYWTHISKVWQKLCGFVNVGYPILPHCPSGGTPHYYRRRDGMLYAAKWDSATHTTMFVPAMPLTQVSGENAKVYIRAMLNQRQHQPDELGTLVAAGFHNRKKSDWKQSRKDAVDILAKDPNGLPKV